MIYLTEEQKSQIIDFANSEIGRKYQTGFKCAEFVRMVYSRAGIECVFDEHPVLTLEDIYKEEFVGYLCFLKNKKYQPQSLYRYTHVGIIAPDHGLIHYSRYFGEPNVREVFRTPMEEIFKVYNFI